MANPITRIKQFYGETVQEIKRCAWLTREELFEYTVVVIVALLLLTGFVFVVDTAYQYLIRWIITLNLNG